MRSNSSKAWGRITNGIPIVIIGIVLLIGALLISGWQFNTVLSGSMEPEMPVGGIVLVRPVSPGEIEVGDVITYHADGNLVTHRVVEVNEGTPLAFKTMGDANEDPDPVPVPAASVIGTVAVTLPFLGYLTNALRSPPGMIFIGLLLLGLIFLNWAPLAGKHDSNE